MKKVIAFGLFIVLCFTIGCFGNAEKADVLMNGIYILRNKSYYAFSPSEVKNIGFFAILVNAGLDMELLGKYSNFSLVTDAGANYPFRISENSVYNFSQDSDEVTRIVHIVGTIYGLTDARSNYIFTSIAYEDECGEVYTQDLGIIEIEIIDFDSDEITANSLEVSFFSTEIPVFSSVLYLFENNTDKDITISDVNYGKANVVVKMPCPIELPSEGERTVEYNVVLDNDRDDELITYAMKPKYRYAIDGVEKIGTFCNISYWTYIIDFDIDMQIYLLEKELVNIK